MADNPKTLPNKQNPTPIVQLFKEYWILIVISIISTYYLQYYIFYAFFIISYPFTKAFYFLYLILYNIIYVIWYIITSFAITLFKVIQFLILWLFYSLVWLLTSLITICINVIILTLSLFLLTVVIVFILTSSNSSENESPKSDDKIQEKNFMEPSIGYSAIELVILPNKKQESWKNPSSRCTCTKLSTTKLIKISQNGETGDEYCLIKNLLQSTRRSHPMENISGYRIQTIERMNNCCIWTKYLNRTWDISKEAAPNIRILFHATISAQKVVEKGFDERFSNKDGMFGAGVYFAEHSSKSNQYAVGSFFAKPCLPHNSRNCSQCIRIMFLCRVTLGNPYKLKRAEKMSHPPPGYHSVEGEPTANGLRYPEYVIYRGEQAYPEYMITYTIINEN